MAIDRTLLPTTNPFDLMDRESSRIEEFLAPLVEAGDDDPRWLAPTRCAGWNARALLGHLRHLEDYNAACVGGKVRELIAGAEVASEFDDFNARGVEQYAGSPVVEVFELWRTKNATYRAAMRALGDGVVDTSVGAYPSLFQSYYLATEYATHGDDFGIASTYEGRDSWRAAFTRFACTEQEKPVAFEEGAIVFQGERYPISDHDLAEAGVARLPDDHPMPPAVRQALRSAA